MKTKTYMPEQQAVAEYSAKLKSFTRILFAEHGKSSATQDMKLDERLDADPALEAQMVAKVQRVLARWQLRLEDRRELAATATAKLDVETRRREDEVKSRRSLMKQHKAVESAGAAFHELGLGAIAPAHDSDKIAYHADHGGLCVISVVDAVADAFATRYDLAGCVWIRGGGWTSWIFNITSSHPGLHGKAMGNQVRVFANTMNQAGSTGTVEQIEVELPIRLNTVALDDNGQIPSLPAALGDVVSVLPGATDSAAIDRALLQG